MKEQLGPGVREALMAELKEFSDEELRAALEYTKKQRRIKEQVDRFGLKEIHEKNTQLLLKTFEGQTKELENELVEFFHQLNGIIKEYEKNKEDLEVSIFGELYDMARHWYLFLLRVFNHDVTTEE
jgi:hypothetical protein